MNPTVYICEFEDWSNSEIRATEKENQNVFIFVAVGWIELNLNLSKVLLFAYLCSAPMLFLGKIVEHSRCYILHGSYEQ